MGAFKTKARAVELLGRKQIRDSVTALAEIMKNAYDADAKLLRVEFLTRDVDAPCIVICDTGVGMDREDLENKWLVLGTPSKLENRKKKTPGGRALMGEKGIGRLALSRLGQQTWMFTKKTNTDWNILYINWNVFENPDLYIEDIEIPVSFDKKWFQVQGEIAKLERIQMSNLLNDSWGISKNLEKKQVIEYQIKNSKPDWELIEDFCGIIEDGEQKQGTVIFSLDLNDDWERYLDPDIISDEDMLAVRNYNRLNSFMTDFGVNEPDFRVMLYHNESPLEFTDGFTEDDYDVYDLRIEGYVEHGFFKGQIDARNADPVILKQCNQILDKGISVTAGIKNWESDDCGRYRVKLCHFEMDKKNTGLTDTEWETIKRRMEKAGGIGVYRDNVRVLPYGEPDNDFLELEERRSKSARYYLFSHRNMFGRIDITSSENPYLEDKSSREGFIENQYYNYFIRTLQNLLIRISVDFAGEMNKNSFKLRQSYLNYNQEKKKEEKKIREFEKEQERQFKEDRNRVLRLLDDNPVALREFERELHGRIEQRLKEIENRQSARYKDLLQNESAVKAFCYETERYIAQTRKRLHIYIDDKFESKYDPKLLDRIDAFNENLDESICRSQNKLTEASGRVLEIYRMRIEKYNAEFEMATGAAMEETLSDLREYLKKIQELSDVLKNRSKEEVDVKYAELLKKLKSVQNYEEDIASFRQEMSEMIEDDMRTVEHNLRMIESEILNPGKPDELKNIRSKINQEEEKIYYMAELVSEKTGERFRDLNGKLDEMLRRFQTDDATLIRQLTIRNSELKQLNDMYADLANLGMAAEIVSHELNQLFNNVYDAINQLRMQGVSSNGKYYLNQIDVGFRAISDRMSQMSPMYRSRNTYRKAVNIYNMLEDIERFFENRLVKQKVRFVNDVPRDLKLKLSLSKIYPVLSNLIYNSLYWMSDKKDRELMFWYDKGEGALYVEDSGEGISARNKERIFEPFFSLKKDGRGLGLTISKNVLEAQGHEIEVVTEPERKYLKGACFKITFAAEAREW